MLKNIKVGLRLGIGIGLIIFFLASVIIFGINRMGLLSEQTTMMYEHPLTVSNAVLRVNTNIIKIHRSMKDIALASDVASIQELSQIVDRLEKEIYSDFEIINKQFLGEKEKYIKALQIFNDWKTIRDEVIALMRSGRNTEAANITRGKGALHVAKIEKAMEVLGDFAQTKAKDFFYTAEDVRQTTFNIMYLLLAGSIVAGMVFAFFLTIGIVRPIAVMRDATEEVGKGKLDTRIDVKTEDEIGQLANSFNKMTDDLKRITASRGDLNKEISVRKRVEKEREQLIAELKAKNTELERFTYTVSHDLKSPLITIRGFLELLDKDANSGDFVRMRGDIKRISNATETMHVLLDDLLQLSRIGRLINPSENVSVSKLAHEVVDRLKKRIKDFGIHVKINPELPVVFGDSQRLLEVFQNLIENAMKFMDTQQEPRIEIGAKKSGSDTICYVRDNGIGIDDKHYDKIFDIFSRLNPEIEGTGVGLAIVKRIIEVHGGRVWVESEGVGKGSTFCFVI